MGKQTTTNGKKWNVPKEAAKPDLLDELTASKETQAGFEQINSATMAIPFLRILQSGSPQLKKNNKAFIPDAEEGQFFNNVTRKVYGKEVEIIVLRFERVFIEWKPNRGGFITYHSPENAERIATDTTFGKWKHGENSLTENYVYMVLVAGEEDQGPMVLSLASTMIKTAKAWNRLLVTYVLEGRRIATSGLVWKLATEYTENDKGEWYVPTVEFSRLITREQLTTVKLERLALPSRQIDYAQLESKPEGNDETKDGQEADDPGF